MEGKAFEARPFHPARWLAGPHAQTVAGRLLRVRRSQASFRRERIELPDGDFVDLDHPADSVAARPDAPLVLLLHGLEGSARRGYALNVYDELARRGVRAVGLNFRSCSGEPNRGARLYHSGDTSDIEFVLRLLADRHPDTARGAIGFSLGGNALLKLLGEQGSTAEALVQAAVAVSVPYDLGAGADSMERTPMGRFYRRRFVKSLVAKVEAKATMLAGSCELDRIRASRSFREFDDAATAPIHGFADAADYYERCSSARYLTGIRLPVLLLHAQDDPFLPADAIPRAAIESNPNLSAIVTTRGGHVGFIEGSPWSPGFWAEETAAAFLAHRLIMRAAVDTGGGTG
jgi:uncharacterized protein